MNLTLTVTANVCVVSGYQISSMVYSYTDWLSKTKIKTSKRFCRDLHHVKFRLRDSLCPLSCCMKLKPYTALAWLWWLSAALHPCAACACYFWCAQPTFPFWSSFSFTQSHYEIVTNFAFLGAANNFCFEQIKHFFNAQFWHPFSTLGVLNILLSRYITYPAFLGHVWIIWISHYQYVTYSLLTSFFVTETSERMKQMMHMHLTMSCQSLCIAKSDLQKVTFLQASMCRCS